MTGRDIYLEPLNGVVYTAMSKQLFYAAEFISAFVLGEGYTPLNPFLNFRYFLYDLSDRTLVRRANNEMVRLADEIWVFGDISDGVQAEIELAESLGKGIKFYTVEKNARVIREISRDLVQLER